MCITNNKYLSAYLYYLIHIYSLIVMSFICIQNDFEGHEISVHALMLCTIVLRFKTANQCFNESIQSHASTILLK